MVDLGLTIEVCEVMGGTRSIMKAIKGGGTPLKCHDDCDCRLELFT